MKRAFTLVELLIVIAMIAVLVCVLMPMASKSRAMDRTAASQANLRLLGSAGASFAANNAGEIYGLDLSISQSQLQVMDILSRLTGRGIEDGEPDELLRLTSILPHRRYQHLVLLDYLGTPANSQITASPFDRNQLNWQQDPVLAQNTTVPYANGYSRPGTDSSSNWPNDDVRQLWPYGSTYQVVPAAWNPNNNTGPSTSWIPIDQTPHLFAMTGSNPGQQRHFPEVVFPSGKVHLFEEFDRLRWRDHLWFAYPEAKCNLLFFDGSARRLASSDSNPGWNPDRPDDFWRQRYLPHDTFPIYALGMKTRDTFYMKYRWTREGLGGIDYGGSEPGRPPHLNPKLNPEPTGRTTNRRVVKEGVAVPLD